MTSQNLFTLRANQSKSKLRSDWTTARPARHLIGRRQEVEEPIEHWRRLVSEAELVERLSCDQSEAETCQGRIKQPEIEIWWEQEAAVIG